MLTVKNSLVDTFIKPYKSLFGNPQNMKATKEVYMERADQFLNENGFGGLDYFSNTQLLVLDYLYFQTAPCGVQKVARDTIAEKSGVSVSTVNRAVKGLKNTGLFEFARLGNGKAGKYVIVSKLHKLFTKAMKMIFNVLVEKVFSSNETSNDTTSETSSNPETPCESKGESQNSASTCYYPKSINNKDDMKNHIIGKMKENGKIIVNKVLEYTIDQVDKNNRKGNVISLGHYLVNAYMKNLEKHNNGQNYIIGAGEVKKSKQSKSPAHKPFKPNTRVAPVPEWMNNDGSIKKEDTDQENAEEKAKWLEDFLNNL